jgi:hypothetical protein
VRKLNRIREEVKLDMALEAQALDNTNVTGDYFPLKGFRSVLAILSGGAMAKTKTTILQLYQAKNAAAGSAKVVTLGTCTITANTLVTELTITLATVLNTETIVINGLTFTGHTDTTTVADREFAIDGNDTADAVEFCICVNDPTYGVPGVTATSALGVVTLKSTVPNETLITAASSDATFTVATVAAQCFVEIDPLITDALFGHLAVKVTSTATGTVAVVLIRGKKVKAITQKMAASYPA